MQRLITTAIIAAMAGTLSGLAGAARAAGNPQQGEQAFTVCRACHQIGADAHNAFGPVLNGIIGRRAASYPGYSYSDAMQGSGITWNAASLQKFLDDPQQAVPGNKMPFAGLHDPAKADDVIAYLALFGPEGATKR